MAKKLYIGNLPWSTTEDSLRSKLSEFGTVESVRIITDRMSGRSKGFGFAEMSSDEEGAAVIAAMDQQDYEGRTIIVREALPEGDRKPNGNRNFGRNDDMSMGA